MSATPDPVNILVVDDRRENRLALRAILDLPEYRILEAGSEQEALHHLLREDCAVILLDVVMPGVDGFELAELIKARDKVAAVPIIFLTAQAIDAEMVRRAYRVGAADYLIKPLHPEMVRAKVAVFAELYRQRQRIEAQSRQLLQAERRASENRFMELQLAGERRYRTLAEAVPHIVWTAQATGWVDYFNRRWFEYTGLAQAETDGSWLPALHPEDCTEAEVAWNTCLDEGLPLEIECRLRRPDGSYRWQLCRALPEHGPTGEIISWLGTFTDVDAQKRIQGVLAELKGMLDAVPDAVLIFDADSRNMVYVNRGASTLLDYSMEELLTLRPADLIPALAERTPQELLEPLCARKSTIETVCRRRDGHEVPVELSLQPVASNGGRIIAIARDITDRRQAEEVREFLYQKALDAVQARDEFLSIASHELRTPLTSLNLQVQSLARYVGQAAEHAEPDVLNRRVEMAARQVGRLVRLIDELLDVSRISGGQFRIEPEATDLSELVGDLLARFAEDAQDAGCELVFDSDGPVQGEWDRIRLEQVAANLVTNALKFGAGKPVEVRVGREGEQALLSVRDHGIGIDDEAQRRIFQRFERASSARSYGGLGLGLYIAQQIVQAHGGGISVTSKHGEGAAFSVSLPLRCTAPDPAPGAPQPASAGAEG